MIKSFPFNAVYDANGVPDRAYLAEDFARYFAKFIGTGVYPNPATGLQVVAIDNNMQIRIKKGDGYILGRDFENTDDYIIQLDVADGVLSRIDRVVLRLDYLKRDIIPVLKKGNYASSPIAPALQRDADAYEIAIGDVYVKNGAIKINQSDITDTRLNKELCGIVHAIIQQVDTTEIFRQFQAWFNEQKNVHEGDFEKWLNEFKIITGKKFTDWVDDLKNSLDPNEDIAAQLQMQISTVKSDLADITTYQTAGGTANAISLNLSTLVNGYATTFIVNKNNNKNATTINGKQLYKPNTTTAPNLVTGKAVSVWYDATKDCFFIKASAEGNAVAKDVLAGKIFSNDDDTGLVGTLDLSNLTSNNIKEGITINGVKGNVKPMKYGIILNLTTKIGYQTSSGYSIPGGGYVLTGRTGPSYYIKCNGIEYYYDYNKSKPNYFPVPFNTGRILYYKGEHRYSTKLSSILKISTSRSNGYDYDVISSFDIAPAGYMPYQMLLVNNNWIILFTKESECIISTYDLNLSTKIKEISLNLDNPCLSYNHIFDIGNSTKIYDYTGKLIKSVEVMKPYDKLVDLNKNAAIGENEYDLGVVLHTEGSDCMCGNIVSPLL
ncbi:hypothetical protein [Clostridium botulinum]|uniref:hypothetical protein n=1 Tax=Clostridium botulinum TaxID=1491 RepID=UPI000AA66447|nr:hypothetical protein [Clostridium botulinum]